MKLGKISPSKGSVSKTKRIGRGNATGQGRTAGKGHNGYKSRSGASRRLHFEGGQTPLARRLPKRGMKIFSKSRRYKYDYQTINLSDLSSIKVSKVNAEILFDKGIIKKANVPKFGRVIVLLVLCFGMLGFVLKELFVYFIE